MKTFYINVDIEYCSCRFLRKHDRDSNKDCYPHLHYPELYILEGGYKNFYENQKVRATSIIPRVTAHLF